MPRTSRPVLTPKPHPRSLPRFTIGPASTSAPISAGALDAQGPTSRLPARRSRPLRNGWTESGTPDIPGTPAIPCVFIDFPAPACVPGTGIPGTPTIPGTPSISSIVTYQNKLPWFGTFRGRLGFTPADRWLLFVTGGLAYGEVTTSETLNVNGAVVAFSTDRTKVGWTVGGGVEAALWGNWTGKLEYLYIDFGTVNDALIGIAPITPVAEILNWVVHQQAHLEGGDHARTRKSPTSPSAPAVARGWRRRRNSVRTACQNHVRIARDNVKRSRCFWSGQLDSNQRPAVPKTAALPGCAIPRIFPCERTSIHACAAASKPPASVSSAVKKRMRHAVSRLDPVLLCRAGNDLEHPLRRAARRDDPGR